MIIHKMKSSETAGLEIFFVEESSNLIGWEKNGTKKKTQKKQSFPKYAIFSEIGPLPLSYSGEKVHISGLDFS